MRVLTIDRSIWLRGEGAMSSYLLSRDGKMCCLGFDALACGLTKGMIYDRRSPDHHALRIHFSAEDFKLRFYTHGVNNSIVQQCMHINDAQTITDAFREEMLTPLLLSLGYDKVEFIN